MQYYNSKNSFTKDIRNYIPIGLAVCGTTVGYRAIYRKNRGDTFIKTAKNCAREYTIENKKHISTFLTEFLNNKKLTEKLNKLSNKKMFALLVTAKTLLSATGVAICRNLFRKN